MRESVKTKTRTTRVPFVLLGILPARRAGPVAPVRLESRQRDGARPIFPRGFRLEQADEKPPVSLMPYPFSLVGATFSATC
jgi:hypothetical protein